MLSADDAAKGKNTASTPAAKRSADHLLATCVALANQGEIAVSEIAHNKSTNNEVKEFAGMLMKDHHAFLEKLHKFAPEATKAGYLDGATKEARTNKKGDKIQQTAATEDKAEVKTADAKSDHANAEFNHMELQRELAAQCLSSAKEKLESKSGDEFDKCFIGHQIGMHQHMKDNLIVLQRHVSPELAEILAAGQKTTEEHLAKAESIMKDLDHQSTTRTVETKRDGKVKERKVTKEKE
jgi:predicted outer membrane protein